MDEYEEITLHEFLGDILDEDTVELLCTCGIWSLYGRLYPIDKHSDWCDLLRKD